MTSAHPATSALSLRPASLAPLVSSQTGLVGANVPTSSHDSPQSSRGARGGPRGRGRGRGRPRGEALEGQTIPTGDFSGAPASPRTDRPHRVRYRGHASARGRPVRRPQITEDGEAMRQNLGLNAQAVEFQPGQPHQMRKNQEQVTNSAVQRRLDEAGRSTRDPRGRRLSTLKSTAPDIATRTHEDISNGVYECPICTSEVMRSSKIWSCRTCWTVFHLGCVEKWSANEGSALAQQRQEDDAERAPRQWRCPGCNLPKDTLPSNYFCWCEKELDPHSIPGLPPHSCGQSCGRKRNLPKDCPHPCDLLCHAGPCPPCSHMGPLQSCFCGKNTTTRRCIDTNYDSGWSCGQICDDPMPCGEHTCPRPCHEGLCGACEVTLEARCYCGKAQRSLQCCERADGGLSIHETNEGLHDEWTGLFDCGKVCQRVFDCGQHSCEKGCHPQDQTSPHCPRAPDVVDKCPCGKTFVEDLITVPRQSCEDPIPNCTKKCSKPLSCGHVCQQVCHAGDCDPCYLRTEISCRCGRTKSSTICHQGSEEAPQCPRACKAQLNCGRHECGERCCSGERKAAERQATKRKLRPLGAAHIIDDSIEAEHICTRVCGRALKCGNHTCPELCHKGPCGTCREAIFDEVSCHCGKTVLQPPLPCGTSPPICSFQCELPKACGHPRVPHSCHGPNESCPKCPFLESKICLCQRNTLKNQPCWLTDVRCGDVCGKKLKCGSHFCRKQCHRAGECEDAGKPCQQACRKPKKACGHPCEDSCHAPSSCREDKPCQNKMHITCECQNLKQEVKCGASKMSEGNTRKTLVCDDECARLARNHRLAMALNIDPETHQNNHVPYSNDTLKMFRENGPWAQTQEKEFRIFAADETMKRLRLKPMPPHQRAFIHSLSKDFGMDSESMDPEPFRHVAIFKTPRFTMAPMKTLAESIRVRSSAEATAAQVTSTNETASSKLKATNEPYNGFLLSKLRFGLTLEEVRTAFSTYFSANPGLAFDISFLPNEEIAVKARSALSVSVLTPASIEASVKSMKPGLSTTTNSSHIASVIQLCALDSSLNILRRELDESVTNGGWSQVVAKASAPRSKAKETPVWGGRSSYTVLGSKVKDSKKKVKEKPKDVADDWEEEVRREEQEERDRKGDSADDSTDDAVILEAKDTVDNELLRIDGVDA